MIKMQTAQIQMVLTPVNAMKVMQEMALNAQVSYRSLINHLILFIVIIELKRTSMEIFLEFFEYIGQWFVCLKVAVRKYLLAIM